MEFEQFSEQEISRLYEKISKGWNDRLAHVFRVYSLCRKFIERYPDANKKILLTSALLHDIGHAKEGEHPINGSKMAASILKEKNFTNEEISKISECIRTHSIKSKETPSDIESKILSDCDRLDVIGIGTWLGVVDSKISNRVGMKEALKECREWEKEWLSLDAKFFTESGEREYKKIQGQKKMISNKIIRMNLKNIRRGALIYLFSKSYDRILLVNRAKFDNWGVIAGKNEEGEDFIRTAVRELMEEVGLKRFLFEFFPSNISIEYNVKNSSLDVLQNFCLTEKEEESPAIKNKEEISGIFWFNINKLPLNTTKLDVNRNLDNFRSKNG